MDGLRKDQKERTSTFRFSTPGRSTWMWKSLGPSTRSALRIGDCRTREGDSEEMTMTEKDEIRREEKKRLKRGRMES